MVSERPRPDRCGARCTSKVGLEVSTDRTESDSTLTITQESIGAVRLRSIDGQSVIEGPSEYASLRQYYWSDYDVEAIALAKDVRPEDVGLDRPGSDTAVEPIDDVVLEGQNYVALESEMSLPTGPDSDRFPQIGRTRPAWGDDVPPKITYQRVDFDEIEPKTRSLLDGEPGSGPLWWIVLADPDTEITHHDTELDGYCEKYPLADSDAGRCKHHGGNVDGPDDDIKRGGWRHGLNAKRSRYYTQLDHDAKLEIETLIDSWLEDAPFDRDHRAKMTELFRIAVDQYRLWASQEQYDNDGMVIENVVGVDPETGEKQTAKDENPMNLAYDRLDSRVYSKLDKLGILGDSEGEDEAIELSLAQKLSGLAEDDAETG
jgi:hypothetical protein